VQIRKQFVIFTVEIVILRSKTVTYMKSFLWISLLSLTLVLLVIGFACRKFNANEGDKFHLQTICTPPDYGDSIIYPKWKGPIQDYIVKPKDTSATGKYFAWPQGMVINSTTGEINVSKSETGIRYSIGFVRTGTQDTCYSTLILGGVTYVDSIYVLEKNDTLAIPYYYANPTAPAVCDPSDDNDYPQQGQHGNNRCEFDDDMDADGNGPGDEPLNNNTANNAGVRVRTTSGVINLKRTLLEGAFGSTTPVNGSSVKVTINYRLNDPSGRVLQRIPLELYYYNKVSDIPLTLRNEIAVKRTNFFNYVIVNGKPRPPMIILTHFSQ
jgi:hypothetical protein